MKRISYAGNSLLTGDAIADAVVHYAEALAQREASAAIDIPVIDDFGHVVTANMLIGPASQLVVLPALVHFDELLAPDTVERFQEETRRLGSPTPGYGVFDAESMKLLDDLEYPDSPRD